MPVAPCWISRGEAWTGADDFGEQLTRLTPEQDETVEALIAAKHTLAPCPTEDCFCYADVLFELCCLDQGHAGPHLFESTADIILVFPEVPK